ncbi:MAG: peptidoglycan DD-metalloendopeptidase family protein [Armatimonadota bacterium]|nr:peptidoglycan DD-metalloendopeptidase family protein [Armatimonadota bacterium]
MTRGWRRRAAGTLAAFLIAAPGAAAPAPSPGALPGKQQELQRVRQELREKRRHLEQARRHERRMADEVQRLDREREATEQRLIRLAVELRRVRQREAAAAAALARAESSLARQRTLLSDRLLDAHRMGRAGYLDVVLGATSFPEFVARARLVSAIIHQDTQLIQTYTSDRDRTADLRQQLEEQHEQVRALMQETEERRQTLAEKVGEKRTILRRIMQERAVAEQAVRELEEDSAQLEALIRRLQGAGAAGPRWRLAAFAMPLRGPFTSRFGLRTHPLFGRRHFHTGVDIAAPRGTPVRVAMDGIVLFAGWYGGYGKLVVVDHGGGISTLYGHLSAILVSAGERVSRSQVIGKVGSTGYSTGPHLHYEVRQNGRPIDPIR